MKLTKGKLSKIYNKKKQTMRKFKTKSKNSNKKGKGKTFRKKRHLNLNKKTLKNVPQIQMRNGRMMAGGEPTPEKLATAKQKIASEEAKLDEQMEESPLSVQAQPVNQKMSVEAQPFSNPYGSQVLSSGSTSNFDAVAQGLKEYIDHTVAVALASSSASSLFSSEDAQNPVSSISAAVETTENGIKNLNSPSSSALKSEELRPPVYASVDPSAPPVEEKGVDPSAPPVEEEGGELSAPLVEEKEP